jgi:hypothetical protein
MSKEEKETKILKISFKEIMSYLFILKNCNISSKEKKYTPVGFEYEESFALFTDENQLKKGLDDKTV